MLVCKTRDLQMFPCHQREKSHLKTSTICSPGRSSTTSFETVTHVPLSSEDYSVLGLPFLSSACQLLCSLLCLLCFIISVYWPPLQIYLLDANWKCLEALILPQIMISILLSGTWKLSGILSFFSTKQRKKLERNSFSTKHFNVLEYPHLQNQDYSDAFCDSQIKPKKHEFGPLYQHTNMQKAIHLANIHLSELLLIPWVSLFFFLSSNKISYWLDRRKCIYMVGFFSPW